MNEMLKEISKDRGIAAFYTNKMDTLKFIVGSIIEIDKDYVIILTVTPYGHYDGLLLKKIEDIWYISRNTLYLEKMRKLVAYHNEVNEILDSGEKDLVVKLLGFSKLKKRVVSIELLHSGVNDIQGYVKMMSEGYCEVSEISDYGEPNGVSTFSLSDITQISCDSEDEKLLDILWNIRNDPKALV